MRNDWIRQTLLDLNRRRSHLGAAPPPGENGPQPTGPAGYGQSLLTGAPAATRAPGSIDSGTRGRALLEAYQAYLGRSGRKQDPLLDRVRKTRLPGGQTQMDEVQPAKLIADPATGQSLRVNTTNNARRGLTLQAFTLPGGQVVHVYYGKNGERTVIRMPKRR